MRAPAGFLIPERVHASLVTRGLGGANLVTGGLGRGPQDPLLQRLEALIPAQGTEQGARARARDIRHLFQCGSSRLDYFWTEDQRTILNHREQLLGLGLRAVSSCELLREIENGV